MFCPWRGQEGAPQLGIGMLGTDSLGLGRACVAQSVSTFWAGKVALQKSLA